MFIILRICDLLDITGLPFDVYGNGNGNGMTSELCAITRLGLVSTSQRCRYKDSLTFRRIIQSDSSRYS